MGKSRNACPKTTGFGLVEVGRFVRFDQNGSQGEASALKVVTVFLYFFSPQIHLLNGPGFSDINRWQRTRERKKGKD